MADAVDSQQTAPDGDPFSLLKLITEAAALFIGLTFVAGWSYLASYYKTFGLNPIELDISVPVVATIALHMLYESVWPLPAAAFFIGVIVVAVNYFIKSRGAYRWWVTGALVFLIFCSATAGLVRGRHNANSDMVEESSTLPLVAFSSKSEAAKSGPPEQPSCVAYQTFGAMDCKLLLHAKGSYYFFRPVPASLIEKTDKLDLFIIVETDVVGVRIQRGVDLGGPK